MAMRGEIKRGRPWTPREIEVLRLLLSGMSIKDIAAKLHVEYRTVKFHLTRIYENLNVESVSGVNKRYALLEHFGRFEVIVRWVPNDPQLFPKEVLPDGDCS